MTEEIWKPIKGYEGSYEVSSYGRIKSFPKGNQITVRILTPRYDKDGYERLKLSNNGTVKEVTVHRIVCSAFVENKFDKKCVNHIDGNKRNNHASNLEWVTSKENSTHASEINLYLSGENCKFAKLKENDVIEIRRKYAEGNVTYGDLSKEYGLSITSFSKIILRKSWKHI